VFCADEQTAFPVDLVRWQQLATEVLLAEGVRGLAELSLLFISELEMAELNESYMGKVGPTDVLAFPIDAAEIEIVVPAARGNRAPDRSPPDPGDMPLLLGDVVVCPAVAARQAPDHAGTVDDELALLVVHGVLHVLGHDHDVPDATVAMRARELELLEAHHWHAPAPAGFRQEHDE
jgi:probable rRNA maturation factor